MSFRIDDILKKKDVPKKRDAEGEILHKALVCSSRDNVWRRIGELGGVRSSEEKCFMHYRNLLYGQLVYVPTTYASNRYKSFNLYTQHTPQQVPYVKFTNCKRKGGQIRFSASQTEVLEKRFCAHKYLSPEERKLLADALNLSDRQVKTWFQNRRAKWRRMHNQCVAADELKKEDDNNKINKSNSISEVRSNNSHNHCLKKEEETVVK